MEVQQFIDEHGDMSTPRTSTLSLFFVITLSPSQITINLVFFPMFNRRQDSGACPKSIRSVPHLFSRGQSGYITCDCLNFPDNAQMTPVSSTLECHPFKQSVWLCMKWAPIDRTAITIQAYGGCMILINQTK